MQENKPQTPRHSKKKKKVKKKWIVRSVLIILFLLAAVAGNRAAAFKWSVQSTLNLMDHDNSNVINNVEKELLSNGGKFTESDDIINILLIGADKRASWKEAGRSDSCMIATLDLKHSKLKLSSLMRDMYIEIPDHGKHKFNAAYSYGGVELLYKTIVSNFGITVQGYAVVDFEAFKKVINTIDGVNVKLTKDEYDYLMKAYHRTSVLKLKEGQNNMNGTQALAYCRIRQVGNSDFGRTERQRYVLQQILTKMKSQSVSKWYETAEAVMPEITSDLDNDKIMEYMKDIIFMGTTEVDQFRVPMDGTYSNDTVNNNDILIVDVDANAKALKKFIFEE